MGENNYLELAKKDLKFSLLFFNIEIVQNILNIYLEYLNKKEVEILKDYINNKDLNYERIQTNKWKLENVS